MKSNLPMRSTNLIFGGIENNAVNQYLNAGFLLWSQWNSFCSALVRAEYCSTWCGEMPMGGRSMFGGQ